jgi:hypothetical protein
MYGKVAVALPAVSKSLEQIYYCPVHIKIAVKSTVEQLLSVSFRLQYKGGCEGLSGVEMERSQLLPLRMTVQFFGPLLKKKYEIAQWWFGHY